MKVTVNQSRCKECGLCIHHCPRHALSKSNTLNPGGYYPVQVDQKACIVCGMCYTTCPDGVFCISEETEGEAR